MNIALVPGEVRREKIEKWIHEYSSQVLRTCYMYVSDLTLAQDAMQDTFLKAWKAMDTFEGRDKSSEKTWIIRIAINTCKNYRKSAWIRHIDKTKIIEELPPSVTGVTEESRDLFLSVMMLNDKLRQAVILYYYHDLTLSETASILAVTPSAVQHRLKKAHDILKKQLEGREK